MPCDECKKVFEIQNKFMHLDDTDGVFNVTLTTSDPINHQMFVFAIGELYRELVEPYRIKNESNTDI